jgi:hypothetical protein
MWHNGDWDWMQKSSRPRIGRAARRRSCHIGIQGLQVFGTGSAAAEAWRTCVAVQVEEAVPLQSGPTCQWAIPVLRWIGSCRTGGDVLPARRVRNWKFVLPHSCEG